MTQRRAQKTLFLKVQGSCGAIISERRGGTCERWGVVCRYSQNFRYISTFSKIPPFFIQLFTIDIPDEDVLII